MVDFTIKPTRLPMENNASPTSESNRSSRAIKASGASPHPQWNGVDRRRLANRRNRLSNKRLLLELRQRRDRRNSAAISVKV